jgi:hypothetical protein
MKTVSQIATSFHEPHHPPRLWASRPHHQTRSASVENRECNAWIQTRLREGDLVMVPAISEEQRVHSYDASRNLNKRLDRACASFV